MVWLPLQSNGPRSSRHRQSFRSKALATQVKTGGDHVQQQPFGVMLARVGENLPKHVHIRVHGQKQVLIDPHGKIPQHGPELDTEYRLGSHHHHGQ